MTDTAKPTPGPWVYYNNTHNIALDHEVHAPEQRVARIYAKRGVESEAQANAALIAEAGTVYHETGITPRQLLEQRDALQERVRELEGAMNRILCQSHADECCGEYKLNHDGIPDCCGRPIDGFDRMKEIARAALAKHGGGVMDYENLTPEQLDAYYDRINKEIDEALYGEQK